MPKPKPCPICKKPWNRFSSMEKVCSPACAIAYVQIEKGKAYDKETTKLKKAFYGNNIGKQHELTQPVFNKMRRLEEFKWFHERGLKPVCISCGKENMDWCCGHFKTVAAQGNLRYDTINTYLQCNKYCNSSLSGNIEGNKTTRGYKKGLLERFGEVEGQKIIDYCETHTEVKKWKCDELIERRQFFNKRIRELENDSI
ncbi:MAG: recombination protein NinG [Flavobacteriales bacterium]|nr:recombination protein NinG [Flavobacteriales bacterium]